MKANIHPTYHDNLKITCACGNIILAGSTKKELRTELCSACHPFYTGRQKLVDSEGRVDKFLEKIKRKQELNEKVVQMAKAQKEAKAKGTEEKASKKETVKKTKKPAAKKTTKKK